jgi:serine phosphatase RsbU (regulator of sigma subunit)/anti-anti-sigma regulatory factor
LTSWTFSESESRPSILIVDDNETLRRAVIQMLRPIGCHSIKEVSSAKEAQECLLRNHFDVVITDLSMPEQDGLSLMSWAKQHHIGGSWIVLTGHGTFDSAVKALQLGAFDFLSKPLDGSAPLQACVRNAFQHQRLLAERNRLHVELSESNARLCDHVGQLEEACCHLRLQAERTQADLRRAALIQQALLPRTLPKLNGLSVQALYRPSQNVGGDLYDVVQLDERHVVLLIADAAGHGLSAAMLAVLFRNHLPLAHPESRYPCRPSDALAAVNRDLCQGFTGPGLFVTAAYCLVDVLTREIAVASAGHTPLLLLRNFGSTERVFHTGPALGLYPQARFAEQQIVLEEGDRLLLYTDGLYDRFSGDAASPSERIAALLREQDAEGPDLLQRLLPAAGELRYDGDADQEDDVTLVLLLASCAPSLLDNGAPPPPQPPREPAETGAVPMLIGQAPGRTVVRIRGRADWTQSSVFHENCLRAIERHQALLLDLTLCEHLDSTFLGTIHELVERADQAGLEVHLQGVMPPVDGLFQELGMQRVTDHVVAVTLPLPNTMEPMEDSDRVQRSQALRVLRAHEGLASLNDRNRREFDPLLEILRREVDQADSSLS